MDVRIYRVQHTGVEQVLLSLLLKVLDQGSRAVVVCDSLERQESLDSYLWTSSPESFIPHGTSATGWAERQPIWLTTVPENPNHAQVLCTLGNTWEGLSHLGFDRLCLVTGSQLSLPGALCFEETHGRWKQLQTRA